MVRHNSIKSHLLRLVFAVALPLAGLAAWNFYATAKTDLKHAREQVFDLARITASDTARFFGQTEELLDRLVARAAISALDPERCDPLIKDLIRLAPRYTNVVTLDMEGQVICSAQPRAPGSRVDPDRFLRLMRGPDVLTVGKAGVGAVTGRWSVPIGRPLLRSQGGIAGAVVLPVDLVNFPVLPSVGGLTANTVVGLISAEGTVLARSAEAERYVGTPLADSRIATREKSGTAVVRAGDGDPQIMGFAPVLGTDWIAFATVPAGEIYSGVKQRMAASALVALAILSFALLLAAYWSRRIVDPVTALARTADDVASGNLAARAPTVGATEIVEVATQFNRMLDSRQRIEAELREADRRFRDMLSGVQLISLVLDTEGRIVYCSEFMLRLTGWRREEAAGQDWFALFLPPELREVRQRYLRAIRAGWVAPQYESEILTKAGERRLVHWSNSVLRSPDSAIVGVASIGHDITERKRAEAALRESEERHRGVLDLMLEGCQIIGFDWRYLYVNDSAAKQARRPKEELLGRSVMDVYPSIEETQAYRALHRCMVERTPCRIETNFEYGDGSSAWYDLSVQPAPEGIFVLSVDISARKGAEDALRESGARLEALTRRVLEAQESERHRIAHELHDEVGGVLTAVKLNLQSLRGKRRGDLAEAALGDGLALVDSAIGTVRSLSLDLRPAILDDLGLIPALRWYCERQAQRGGIPIELSMDAVDLKTSPQLESACFRIVQEAVTNALRHASAPRIQIALRLGESGLLIDIADDGVGFEVVAARRRGLAGASSGLLGMEERANLLGGRLHIDSTPGAGTRVRAELPLQEGGFS